MAHNGTETTFDLPVSERVGEVMVEYAKVPFSFFTEMTRAEQRAFWKKFELISPQGQTIH